MTLNYSLTTAFRGLETNRSRAVLTILGIVIGITAIIMVMAVGQGAQNLIVSQLQGLGTKTVIVIPGREPTGPSDIAQSFSDSLKERDLDFLKRRENVPGLSRIMPLVFGGETAAYESETYRMTLFGGTELAAEIFDLVPSEGEFIAESDVRGRADVAVIGTKVKEELFGAADALGRRIKVKGRNLRVIGVLPSKGQVSFFNFDEAVLMPYTTAQQYIFGIKYFHRLLIEAQSEAVLDETVGDVKRTLREAHGITDPEKDDFFVQTQTDLVARLSVVTDILTLLLVSVAAISLVVGGIGIMNIMLVSVTERTREIGLRKALGATGRDILTQFLLEAVMLTVTGGVIGVLLGALLSLATSVVLSQVLALDWGFALPLSAIALGFGVSALVGLVFGIYPARKASHKSPIEALRYE